MLIYFYINIAVNKAFLKTVTRFSLFDMSEPNVLTVTAPLLIFILEVPGSNLVRNSDYPV
jgi:hypothetical protein